MSKIGKKTIEIPEGVDMVVNGQEVKVKGPLGELNLKMPDFLKIEKVDNGYKVIFKEKMESKERMRFWGLNRTLISNMVTGVKDGFKKELELQGVGFRVQLKGKDLELHVGYSHPVLYKVPDGVTVEVDKEIIKVKGIKKQLVGQVAAEIRKIKKPDAYKGKGLRFKGEEVRLKQGKKAVGESA